MKKFFTLFLIIIANLSIYAIGNNFELSDEKLTTYYFTESEYTGSKFYNEALEFSQGIEVYSLTENVSITINGKKINNDILISNNLTSGSYSVRISALGYKPINLWINLESGKRVVIECQLQRNYGYLDVKTNTENFELYLNGVKVDNGHRIPTGFYTLKVKAFGYSEYSEVIYIYNLITENLRIEMERAPFKLEMVSGDKNIFNPSAKENFGVIKFYVNTNGPEHGILKIFDNRGVEVYSSELDFKTWSTESIYTGFDNSGEILTDGMYRVEVTSGDQKQFTSFSVDKDLIQRNILNYASKSGEFNSGGVSQLSFGIGGGFNNGKIGFPINYKYYFNSGYLVDFGFDIFGELNNRGTSGNVNLSLGKHLDLEPFMINLLLGYNLNLTNIDSKNSNISSINFNLPITISNNNINFTIGEGVEYFVGDGVNFLTQGAVFYDNQRLRFGLSGNIKYDSKSILSYKYGGDFSILLPESQAFASIAIGVDNNLQFETILSLTVLN